MTEQQILERTEELVVAITELARALAAIKVDVPSLHQRKCHECGEVHWHADNVAPYVLCPNCGSQDTRLERKPTREGSRDEDQSA